MASASRKLLAVLYDREVEEYLLVSEFDMSSSHSDSDNDS
jgi:hypothetical protein